MKIYKNRISTLMYACIALLLFASCDESDVPEPNTTSVQVQVLDESDQTLNTLSPGDGHIGLHPGIYGPYKIKSRKAYKYAFIPKHNLYDRKTGRYFIRIYELGHGVALNTIINSNTVSLTFPKKGPNKKWEIMFTYSSRYGVDWAKRVITVDPTR